MSLEIKIHHAQTVILRELLFFPEASFSQLQKSADMPSDHFTFHINRLIELKFVKKASNGRYRLTRFGKEYANRLDTEQNTIERQPKISVILVVWRDSAKRELLIQRRLKNPFYGYSGYPTGKVRWGETFPESANRELAEEAGLSANFEYRGIYHEVAYLEDGYEAEDKVFIVMQAIGIQGVLIDAEGCHNSWMGVEEVRTLDKTFPGFDTVLGIAGGRLIIREDRVHYPSSEF